MTAIEVASPSPWRGHPLARAVRRPATVARVITLGTPLADAFDASALTLGLAVNPDVHRVLADVLAGVGAHSKV